MNPSPGIQLIILGAFVIGIGWGCLRPNVEKPIHAYRLGLFFTLLGFVIGLIGTLLK